MGHRTMFIAGLGVGYVLGARAGRARYEAIARTAQKLRDHPAVQSSAGVLQAQAGSALNALRSRLGQADQGGDAEFWRYNESETAGRTT